MAATAGQGRQPAPDEIEDGRCDGYRQQPMHHLDRDQHQAVGPAKSGTRRISGVARWVSSYCGRSAARTGPYSIANPQRLFTSCAATPGAPSWGQDQLAVIDDLRGARSLHPAHHLIRAKGPLAGAHHTLIPSVSSTRI